jgi:hypothetical protein
MNQQRIWKDAYIDMFYQSLKAIFKQPITQDLKSEICRINQRINGHS